LIPETKTPKEKTPLKDKKRTDVSETLDEMVVEEKKKKTPQRQLFLQEETPVVHEPIVSKGSNDRIVIENTPKPIVKDVKRVPNTLPTRMVEQVLEFDESSFDPCPELKFAEEVSKTISPSELQLQLRNLQVENSADYSYTMRYIKNFILPNLKFDKGVAVYTTSDKTFTARPSRIEIIGKLFAAKGYHFEATIRTTITMTFYAPDIRINKKK
jgi:hypothetical protein